MRTFTLKPHLSTTEIASKLSKCNNTQHRGYWQILLSVSFNPNRKAEEYALFLGLNKSKVYKVVQRYNKIGPDFDLDLKWGGRRNSSSHMSFDEEVKLMDELKKKASLGQILTAKSIKSILEKKLNKVVSDDFIWDLFKRHNWKKKMPRQEHPKHNQGAQEEFKKNSLPYWQPSI